MSLWQDTESRSRELVAKAIADGGLDHAAATRATAAPPACARCSST